MSKFRINSWIFACFEAIKSSVIFLQLCAQFTINNLPLYIFYVTSASRKKNRFEIWYLGNIGSNPLIKLDLFVSFNLCYQYLYPLNFMVTLYCTPITLLNRPHAAYCLVVIYFPHPYSLSLSFNAKYTHTLGRGKRGLPIKRSKRILRLAKIVLRPGIEPRSKF